MLFFTDKTYRRAKLKGCVVKFCALPGVKHIISWWWAWKFYQKTKKMTPWERYLARKQLEWQSKILAFGCKLVCLMVCIMAEERNDEEFLRWRKAVLEDPHINSNDLKDFKAWLEQITPEERNYAPVQKIIEFYTK
jgi:hypothetical protein